eukprot:6492338-Amphidinium_carterae.2
MSFVVIPLQNVFITGKFLPDLFPFRHLLPQTQDVHTYVEACKRKLQKLHRGRPSAITGRHVYLADRMLKKDATDRYQHESTVSRQRIMQVHARHYNALSGEDKQRLDTRAFFMREERAKQRTEAIQEARDNLAGAKHSASLLVSDKKFGAMQLSAAAWTPQVLIDLQTLWDSELFTARELKQQRSSSTTCPRALSDDEWAGLLRTSPLQESHTVVVSETIREIAASRAFLSGAVFGVDAGDTFYWWRMIIALQRPVEVVWQPLTMMDLEETTLAGMTAGEWRSDTAGEVEFCWYYEPGEFVHEDIFKDVATQNIYVVGECEYRGPGIIVSAEELHSWSSWFKRLQLAEGIRVKADVKTKERTGAHAKGDAAGSDVAMADLLALDGADPQMVVDDIFSEAESEVVAGASDEDSQSDNDYEELFEEWQTLQDAREHWVDEDAWMMDQFSETILGGAWNVVRSGKILFGVRTDTRKGSLVHTFATYFAMAQSASFESEKYGASEGRLLADLWRRRMYHISCHWRDEGCPQVYPLETEPPLALSDETQAIVQHMTGFAAQRAERILAMSA